jgi:hypothetical protein
MPAQNARSGTLMPSIEVHTWPVGVVEATRD